MGQRLVGYAFLIVLFLIWASIYEAMPGARGLLIIITISGVALVSRRQVGP